MNARGLSIRTCHEDPGVPALSPAYRLDLERDLGRSVPLMTTFHVPGLVVRPPDLASCQHAARPRRYRVASIELAGTIRGERIEPLADVAWVETELPPGSWRSRSAL